VFVFIQKLEKADKSARIMMSEKAPTLQNKKGWCLKVCCCRLFQELRDKRGTIQYIFSKKMLR
jgi:hypothetical protein